MISPGHARALLGVEDPKLQYNLAQQVFDQKMSVRETEKAVKNLGKEKVERDRKTVQISDAYKSYENKLKISMIIKLKILKQIKLI